jgi:large subunit ribosomal protein L9
MKVILLSDVPQLGRKYDVVTVTDGYGMNFLVARKLAEVATPAKLVVIEARQLEAKQARAAEHAALEAAVAKLKGVHLDIVVKANDQGHLYSSITASDVVTALMAQRSVQLSEDMIAVEPIKELGKHTITVTAGKVEATVVLDVAAAE